MKALKACSTRLSTNNNIDYRLWYLSSSSNSSSRERRSGDLLHRWASSLSFWTQDRSSVVLVLRGWSTGLIHRAGSTGWSTGAGPQMLVGSNGDDEDALCIAIEAACQWASGLGVGPAEWWFGPGVEHSSRRCAGEEGDEGETGRGQTRGNGGSSGLLNARRG